MVIPYEYRIYDCEQFTDGISTADQLHLPHEQVYKTLVTQAKSGGYYVFVIPIEEEIDLKKAARAAGEKSLEMVPVRTLTTGYGLCAWWMYSDWHEKAVSDHHPGRCVETYQDVCKWRKTGNAVETCSRGF